jgi:hypothetical protein
MSAVALAVVWACGCCMATWEPMRQIDSIRFRIGIQKPRRGVYRLQYECRATQALALPGPSGLLWMTERASCLVLWEYMWRV